MTDGYTLREKRRDLPYTDRKMQCGLFEQQCTNDANSAKKTLRRAVGSYALSAWTIKNGSIQTVDSGPIQTVGYIAE